MRLLPLSQKAVVLRRHSEIPSHINEAKATVEQLVLECKTVGQCLAIMCEEKEE